MRVLWSVNVLPPNISKLFYFKIGHAISWVEAMAEQIKSEVTLAIVAPSNEVEVITSKEIDGILYYAIPSKRVGSDIWKKIIDSFKPDIVHAYGTEGVHNCTLVEVCKNKIPIIISLQGLISEYVNHYFAGISFSSIFKHITIWDFIRSCGFFKRYWLFQKQIRNEQFILKNVQYVEGRSEWDKAASLKINKNLKYFYCPRMIRKEFYKVSWDKKNYEKQSIFVHQGNYSIKGLHILLDALYLVKQKYPDFKLYVSGNNIFNKKSLKEKVIETGYEKLIKHKIVKYNLIGNIVFTGFLNAHDLANKISKVNVCVNTSSIENMPNSVVEAMLVGCPIIASYVGGTPEMLNEGECGFLYNYNEPNLLATKIMKTFELTQCVIDMANNAKKVSHKRHNQVFLRRHLLDIYFDVTKRFGSNL